LRGTTSSTTLTLGATFPCGTASGWRPPSCFTTRARW
jgi:hypothetical protein